MKINKMPKVSLQYALSQAFLFQLLNNGGKRLLGLLKSAN